jgi:aerobic C4-dicarboxylate transport protein
MGALRWLKLLYVQVLIGIALGVLVGALWPETGAALKPLGDAFIKLIKLTIAPVIFCTVAAGIAHMSDLKKFGRVGGKALLYFEIVSTFALLIGLIVGNLVRPGAGFGIDPATLDPSIAAGYAEKASADTGLADHLLKIIPDTFVGAFAGGDLLQVLFVAILTGFACTRLGAFGDKVAEGLDHGVKVFFSIIHIVVRAAPVGAFGAMAFTIGRYGLDSLVQLGSLIATFYVTALLFVFVVLGVVARIVGFSIVRFLAYIREELLIVLGASSSEAVLPQMMEKLERLGASKPVVGLVIPTGYSFNLDGTNIYMTLATLFLAQATGTHLDLWQMLTLLGVAMITSKGASGVTGAGFITLAATLAVVPDIPIQSLALLVGIDRFMSECRALTNLIGNGVATLAVARWENELDLDQLRTELARGPTQAEIARDHEEMLDEVEALDQPDID